MTGPLIDPEGRCERCGRLVPIECPEPDGLSCGTYVLSPAHASLGTDGRITTVYPSGESYTDPLGARGCPADEHGGEDPAF